MPSIGIQTFGACVSTGIVLLGLLIWLLRKAFALEHNKAEKTDIKDVKEDFKIELDRKANQDLMTQQLQYGTERFDEIKIFMREQSVSMKALCISQEGVRIGLETLTANQSRLSDIQDKVRK